MASSGSAVPILNKGHFSKLKLLLPHKDIQNNFEQLLKPLSETILNNQFQNVELSNLRDTLLPSLLSGELSVSAAEEFVEGV